MSATDESSAEDEVTRRDFIHVATGSFVAIGAAAAAWPLVSQMQPDASVRALSSIEIDVSPLEPGESITVKWRGNPVFVRRRTEKEIAEARDVSPDALPDPLARNANVADDASAEDQNRVREDSPELIVLLGVCTHLGCVPIGQSGDFGGWYCPCHGSHYDTSGRIRRGPAPENLPIPRWKYVGDGKTAIKIG